MSEELLQLLISRATRDNSYQTSMIMYCALKVFSEQLKNNREAIGIMFGQELFKVIEEQESKDKNLR